MISLGYLVITSRAVARPVPCLFFKLKGELKKLSHSLTNSVSLNMLNNFCFHIYAQKSLSHSFIHSLSTCWTTFVFMSMLKSHSLTFTLSHSHTLTLSHSHTLALSHSFNLSFNHSRHAEQVLFSSLCSKVYRRKLQCFFLTSSPPHPLTLEFIELVPS